MSLTGFSSTTVGPMGRFVDAAKIANATGYSSQAATRTSSCLFYFITMHRPVGAVKIAPKNNVNACPKEHSNIHSQIMKQSICNTENSFFPFPL